MIRYCECPNLQISLTHGPHVVHVIHRVSTQSLYNLYMGDDSVLWCYSITNFLIRLEARAQRSFEGLLKKLVDYWVQRILIEVEVFFQNWIVVDTHELLKVPSHLFSACFGNWLRRRTDFSRWMQNSRTKDSSCGIFCRIIFNPFCDLDEIIPASHGPPRNSKRRCCAWKTTLRRGK